MNRLIVLLMISGLIPSSFCYSQHLMDYYNPIGQNPEVKVFHYINPANPNLTEYWKTTTDPDRQTLLTESYTATFERYNLFKEFLTADHAQLIQYLDFELDNGNQEIVGQIKKNIVYSSNASKPYHYSVNYTNQYGAFLFEKQRKFAHFDTLEIYDQTYSTAVFEDNYTITHLGEKQRVKWKQKTYYSKELGMVKYIRHLPNGEIRVLELKAILSESEFEELRSAFHHHK